jgi:hypothetical protein
VTVPVCILGWYSHIHRTDQPTTETGSGGGYFWLTSVDDDLDALLTSCPQVVLGRYLAVTSFDSGSLLPNEDQVLAGWENRAGIGFSPKIESVEKLPHDLYDEWYAFKSPRVLRDLSDGNVFETSIEAGQVAAFVNFGGFSLHSPEMKALADLFWMQLELIEPESFIADGSLLNFVTRDEQIFATSSAALR